MSRELGNEDEAWRAYLEQNGIETSDMGEPMIASASAGTHRELEARM